MEILNFKYKFKDYKEYDAIDYLSESPNEFMQKKTNVFIYSNIIQNQIFQIKLKQLKREFYKIVKETEDLFDENKINSFLRIYYIKEPLFFFDKVY